MLNFTHVLKRPATDTDTDTDKAYLFARLDLLRALIEAGEPIKVYDSMEQADAEGVAVQASIFHFVVPDEVRTRYWRAQRENC